MEITSDVLKRIMLAVSHSISDDETRQPLRAVNIRDGFSIWESTDGHRATRVTLSDKEAKGKGDFLAVAEDFRALAKALPTGKKTVMVTLERVFTNGTTSTESIKASFGAQAFTLRCNSGYSFPELSRVIPLRPEKGAEKWGINPRYLSEACDAGETFAGKGAPVVVTPCPYDDGENTRGQAFAPMRLEAKADFGEMLTIIMPVRI